MFVPQNGLAILCETESFQDSERCSEIQINSGLEFESTKLQFDKIPRNGTNSYNVQIELQDKEDLESIYAIKPDGSRTEEIYEDNESIVIKSVSLDEEIRVIGTLPSGSSAVIARYTV